MYFHKNIRLVPVNYIGQRAHFVTLCCHERSIQFREPENSEWFLAHLRDVTAASFFAVIAYCVMPDHVHLLVMGLSPRSDFLGFMKALKIKTSRELVKRGGGILWQKKYFDHILRPKESMDAAAWYISATRCVGVWRRKRGYILLLGLLREACLWTGRERKCGCRLMDRKGARLGRRPLQMRKSERRGLPRQMERAMVLRRICGCKIHK